jgi:hypothetical protein
MAASSHRVKNTNNRSRFPANHLIGITGVHQQIQAQLRELLKLLYSANSAQLDESAAFFKD